MIPAMIQGATRNLGAPKNWTAEDGICRGLPIRDDNGGGQNLMTSAWEPTPAELDLLNKGAKIYLTIVGTGHPPVSLWVNEESVI